ncbi:MAG: nitrous oxide-stimulated promoter family protein [Deltaproteobacteria bacterium]|nr:nitrous oxide-stimulated promoter family protein [Deltaproteobacteria bacterium]
MFSSRRMQREAETIEAMIRIYCREQHHGGESLCAECSELLDYARLRLQKCPFQAGKTTCGKCPIHCYRPEQREQIRKVMRFVGPRMLLHHPLLGIMHMVDGLRKKPKKPRAG